MDVPPDETTRILGGLGFGVRTLGGWQAAAPEASTPLSHAGHAWNVLVPGWRVDVHRAVDLVEEVGRHYGFEHLPSTFPPVEQPPPPSDPRIARDARIRRALLGMGMSEAITFAFIESEAAAPFVGADAPVALANPLSEKFATLRPSLLPGLIDAVSHNRRHGRRDVRLFEIGTRFSPQRETRAAAAAWTGAATPHHWSAAARDVDFFDVKGVAEQLCATMEVTCEVIPGSQPYLVEGRAAELRVGAAPIGFVGQLAPAVAERRDLPEADAIYVLEIDLDALAASAERGARFAKPLPRHPSVVRDVALLVDDTLSAETVRGTIRAAGPATLVDVREFDRYQGKGIAEGKVSLALRLTFQAPDRTLTDSEVQAAMERIVAELHARLGAIQR
jgi:phenylalanyl-tRNA synthetase beta chain